MIKKRFLSALLSAAFVLVLLPTSAQAAQGSDFTVTTDKISGTDYTYDVGVLTFLTPGDYTVSMASGVTSTTTDKIVVNGGTPGNPVNVTLDNVSIDASGTTDACAFGLLGTSVVNLTLADGTLNSLVSGYECAGLQVPEKTHLTIVGSGALSASTVHSAGQYGAGIGGTYGCPCGSITIAGGTVTASASFGAGIGGGIGGSGGAVTITGGTVTATSGAGAGIGGGDCGNGGMVNITGGAVTATSAGGAGIGGGDGNSAASGVVSGGSGGMVIIQGGAVSASSTNGAGIGGGYGYGLPGGSGGTVQILGGTINSSSTSGAGIGGGSSSAGTGGAGGAVTITGGSVHAAGGGGSEIIGKASGGTDSGTLKSGNGTNVYLATVTLNGSSGAAAGGVEISSYTSSVSYGIEDMKTDAGGKLYLYLPEGSCDLQFSDGTYGYAAAPTVNTAGTAAVTANDLSSTRINITEARTYYLTQSSGTATANIITVNGGTAAAPINITVSDLNIDVSTAAGCAFELQNTSCVHLTLTGDSFLTSGDDYAGLQLPESASVIIDGGGSVTAAGGSNLGGGAGIGGNYGERAGFIRINGGNITAQGGDGAAGIGGGKNGRGGTTVIDGGTIAAQGGTGGAGIGGGSLSGGGAIQINGGEVTATGGQTGAGIGGGEYSPGGDITISAGVVIAGSGTGAGIGGGTSGNGGDIAIGGGTVTATSSGAGAGIGGGEGGDGGIVYISGGSVKATGGTGASAVGMGSGGTDSGTLQNDSADQTPVFITAAKLSGVTVKTAVSALTVDLDYTYGAKDMYTDANGILYLYLPEDTLTWGARTPGQGYSGAIATATDPAASLGTLTADSTLPSVTDFMPSGANTPVSGSVTVKFSEVMDKTAGAVSLGGGSVLAGGSWSNGNTVYTAPYSALSYNTPYTAVISGFKDAAGNTMPDDSTHGFTTAQASVNPGGGGSTTGQAYDIDITTSGGTTTAAVTVTAVLSADGTLNAALTSSLISQALERASQSGADNIVLELVLSSTGTASGLKLSIPAGVLSGLSDGAVSLLRVASPIGVFSFDARTLSLFERQANGDISIGISRADTSTLSQEARALLGGRPAYSFTVTAGNTVISDFGGGTVTVSLPYKPAEGEDTDSIIIYYISASGELIAVPSCVYDAKTGTVTFTTNRFSTYAVGYNDVRFTDISGWYKDDVEFITARGIMNGTGSDTFNPNGPMTRAMLVTVLYRLGGDTGIYTNTFSDVPSGAWYENAVAWAAKNGVAGGVGNGLFAPNTEITREQLAAMLYNYAKFAGYDVSVGEDTNILSYDDAFDISDYAYAALQWACGAGIMNGDDDGNLSPQGRATRAEVAAMLQRLIKNMIG